MATPKAHGSRSASASTVAERGSVVGEGSHVELTAVGDTVNVAARLAAAAAPGELLVSADAAAASDLEPSLERRSLPLKGKTLDTEVVSIRLRPE